jgi:hypothetical protein
VVVDLMTEYGGVKLFDFLSTLKAIEGFDLLHITWPSSWYLVMLAMAFALLIANVVDQCLRFAFEAT